MRATIVFGFDNGNSEFHETGIRTFYPGVCRDWFSRDTDHVVFNEGFVAGDVEYVHDSSGEL